MRHTFGLISADDGQIVRVEARLLSRRAGSRMRGPSPIVLAIGSGDVSLLVESACTLISALGGDGDQAVPTEGDGAHRSQHVRVLVSRQGADLVAIEVVKRRTGEAVLKASGVDRDALVDALLRAVAYAKGDGRVVSGQPVVHCLPAGSGAEVELHVPTDNWMVVTLRGARTHSVALGADATLALQSTLRDPRGVPLEVDGVSTESWARMTLCWDVDSEVPRTVLRVLRTEGADELASDCMLRDELLAAVDACVDELRARAHARLEGRRSASDGHPARAPRRPWSVPRQPVGVDSDGDDDGEMTLRVGGLKLTMAREDATTLAAAIIEAAAASGPAGGDTAVPVSPEDIASADDLAAAIADVQDRPLEQRVRDWVAVMSAANRALAATRRADADELVRRYGTQTAAAEAVGMTSQRLSDLRAGR